MNLLGVCVCVPWGKKLLRFHRLIQKSQLRRLSLSQWMIAWCDYRIFILGLRPLGTFPVEIPPFSLKFFWDWFNHQPTITTQTLLVLKTIHKWFLWLYIYIGKSKESHGKSAVDDFIPTVCISQMQQTWLRTKTTWTKKLDAVVFFPEKKITTHHMVKTAAFFFFNTLFLDLDTNTTPLKQRTRLGTHSAPATTRKRHASPPNFLSAFFRLKKQRQRIKLQHLPNVHPPGLGLLIRQSGKHHLTSCWFISPPSKNDMEPNKIGGLCQCFSKGVLSGSSRWFSGR